MSDTTLPAPTPREALAAFFTTYPPAKWRVTAEAVILAPGLPKPQVILSTPIERALHDAAALRLFGAAADLALACLAVAEARAARDEAQTAITMAYPDFPSATMMEAALDASEAASQAAAMARAAAVRAGIL
jgi:hypothetical protein